MKSTVQKPLPIKFKSKKSEKAAGDTKKEEKREDKKEVKQEGSVTHAQFGPRTLTCYICGREFGTASLHLHEPRCLQVKFLGLYFVF